MKNPTQHSVHVTDIGRFQHSSGGGYWAVSGGFSGGEFHSFRHGGGRTTPVHHRPRHHPPAEREAVHSIAIIGVAFSGRTRARKKHRGRPGPSRHSHHRFWLHADDTLATTGDSYSSQPATATRPSMQSLAACSCDRRRCGGWMAPCSMLCPPSL